MTFRKIENILLMDGWMLKNVKGSHYQYIHRCKSGKVTIPKHCKYKNRKIYFKTS